MALKERVICVRHTEHLADHARREWHSQCLYHVGRRTFCGHLGDQFVDDLLDPWPEGSDALRHELWGKDEAQTGVIGRVHVGECARPDGPVDWPHLRKTWPIVISA